MMPDDSFITETLAQLTKREPRDRPEIKVFASGLGDLLEVRDFKRGKSTPSGCRRKLYLDHFPDRVTPDAMPFESALNFEVGNAYHEILMKKLQEAGHLIASEVPLKKWHPHISGRLDDLIMHPTRGLCVVDGKSTSKWAFDNLDGAKPGDVAQVMHYLDVLGLQWGCLFYYCKENGRVKEYWFQRSPEVAAEINRAAKAFVEKVSSDKLAQVFDPPAMPEGVKQSAWPCSWGREGARCKFWDYCHGKKDDAEGEIHNVH